MSKYIYLTWRTMLLIHHVDKCYFITTKIQDGDPKVSVQHLASKQLLCDIMHTYTMNRKYAPMLVWKSCWVCSVSQRCYCVMCQAERGNVHNDGQQACPFHILHLKLIQQPKSSFLYFQVCDCKHLKHAEGVGPVSDIQVVGWFSLVILSGNVKG